MEFETTDARIAHLVAHSAGISRTELSAALRLPAPTVTSAVRRLLTQGVVVEIEQAGPRSVSGRRPHLLLPTGQRRVVGVVDWTRTELQLVLADYGGHVLDRSSAPAPEPSEDPTVFGHALERLRSAADALHPDTDLTAVVISVPAPFQRGVGSPGQRLGVRRNPRAASVLDAGGATFYAGLSVDPAGPLSERFGVTVHLENDANLAALGEFSVGAGRRRPDQLFVLLDGQSIGAGVIVGGRIVRGASGYAGELAHVQVDDDGPLCACGGRGCLAGRLDNALLGAARSSDAPGGTLAEVVTKAAAGDVDAARILHDVGGVLGRPLADVCAVLNPGLVVVDGRLAGAASFVAAGIREQVERFTPPAIASSIDIVPGAIRDDVAVYGAIHLVRSCW